MPYGIVDYLLRARESACFYLAAELGFDCLDLAVDRIGDPTRLLFDPQRQGEIANLAKSTGVTVAAVYAIHFLRENLVAPEERTRRPAVLALRGLAEQVNKIGITTVVLPLLAASQVKGDAEAIAFQVLEQNGVWSDLENVQFALKTDLSAAELLPYLDQVGCGSLGVCFDRHRAGRGDPVREETDVSAGQDLSPFISKTACEPGQPHTFGVGGNSWEPILRGCQLGTSGPLVLETPAGHLRSTRLEVILSFADSERADLLFPRGMGFQNGIGRKTSWINKSLTRPGCDHFPSARPYAALTPLYFFSASE
ncbi:MAG: TIM barrel protein [Planctomycetota bacterium]